MDEQRYLRAEQELYPDQLDDRFDLLARGGAGGITRPMSSALVSASSWSPQAADRSPAATVAAVTMSAVPFPVPGQTSDAVGRVTNLQRQPATGVWRLSG